MQHEPTGEAADAPHIFCAAHKYGVDLIQVIKSYSQKLIHRVDHCWCKWYFWQLV